MQVALNSSSPRRLSSSASTASTSSSTSTTTTITFSVWDGDWAVLEEYTTGNVLVESYVQGYHGLVKTLVSNIYYYQDELGSTSHVAGGTGALIESYQYDLYGKPRVYNSGGTYQPNATPLAKDLGNGGARWITEIGLYDDRNRFMSPDLGRIQALGLMLNRLQLAAWATRGVHQVPFLRSSLKLMLKDMTTTSWTNRLAL